MTSSTLASNRTRFWGFFALLATLALALGPTPAAHARADDDAVKVRALAEHPKAEQGGRLLLAVEMVFAEKYHAWPAAEVELPASVNEFAIRTEIGLAEGAPSWAAAGTTRYPKAKPAKVPDPSGTSPTGSIEVPCYAGTALSFIPITIAPDAPLGEHTLNVRVAYQACDDVACLMPQDLTFPVKFTVIAAGQPRGDPIEPAIFTKADRASLIWAPPGAPTPTPTPTPTPAPADTAPLLNLTPVPAGTIFGLNLGTGAFLLGLGAIVGGFLLNLTPCVLPVIPIKVLTLTQHAGSRSRAVVLSLWMALGVVAFWTAIGLPVAFISQGIDPSRYIFGIWWITLIIGLIIALMGLGIMGLFNITLPQSVYAVEAKADTPTGSILYGVMTAVLGLPCFGFVAGGLLAGAAALPPTTIMAIFVGLGVGMAFPYVILAAYPNLLSFLPRTGPASDLLKQVLGILLIAAAAFFVAAGIKALLTDMPYLSGSMKWWAVGFFVAVAAVWLTVRTLQISKSAWPKVVMPLLGLIGTLGIGVFASATFRDDRDNYLALKQRLGESAGQTTIVTGVWMEYSPELYAAVRKAGKPVFLDFTADWCINCKAFKKAFLDTDPVRSRLRAAEVVLLEVDLTSTRAPGWDLLKSLGRTGIPTWAIYGPGADAPVLVDLTVPTSENVLASLDKAGVPKAAAPAMTSSQPVTPSGR
jgi:thiol:disulfide interchange protein DsbD